MYGFFSSPKNIFPLISWTEWIKYTFQLLRWLKYQTGVTEMLLISVSIRFFLVKIEYQTVFSLPDFCVYICHLNNTHTHTHKIKEKRSMLFFSKWIYVRASVWVFVDLVSLMALLCHFAKISIRMDSTKCIVKSNCTKLAENLHYQTLKCWSYFLGLIRHNTTVSVTQQSASAAAAMSIGTVIKSNVNGMYMTICI